MIVINCALKQNEIIEVVNGLEMKGEKPFSFKEKKGIKLVFNSTHENNEEACLFIKGEIKKTNFGSALLFNVAEEA